jgi:hypothetical protein
MSDTCGGCGARIVWAITRAGKRQPFDVKPEKRAVLRTDLGIMTATIVDTYMPHHVTCPQADMFRKDK